MTADERVALLTVFVEQLTEQLQTHVAQSGLLIESITALNARVDSLDRQCSALHQRTIGLLVAK